MQFSIERIRFALNCRHLTLLVLTIGGILPFSMAASRLPAHKLNSNHRAAELDFPANDSLPRNRLIWVSAANLAAFSGSLLLLNEAWYKDQDRSSFHFFNDSREWLQVDKTGHAWSAYTASRATSAMWRWAGLSNKKAALAGSVTSFVYMAGIEVLDAYAEKWGWSWADMAANGFGTGLHLFQELTWSEQRIQFKFSFHRNNYADAELHARANDLYGSGFSERMLKDYNAQTYWLSVNIRSFFPESKWPSWLNMAAGYGAEGMFGGFENSWTNMQGVSFDRRDIPRRRQFYLAPDIDLTRIKTRSRFLKTTFWILNSFKVPAPTLMLDNKGKFRFYPLYF